jgi:hypothetical protein
MGLVLEFGGGTGVDDAEEEGDGVILAFFETICNEYVG